jgi:hypothetical protein
MAVVEEPFVHGHALAEIFRPGYDDTPRLIGGLRSRRVLSAGFDVKTPLLRKWGIPRLRLYSALNLHAARFARVGEHEAARDVSRRATEIEQSDVTSALRSLIEEAAELVADWVPEPDPAAGIEFAKFQRSYFRSYLFSSEAVSAGGLSATLPDDPRGLTKALAEWLTRAASWASANETATRKLVAEASKQLAEASTDVAAADACTLVSAGRVLRLERSWAHVVSNEGAVFPVPRDLLDRRGLGNVGQPVTVMVERLRDGIQITLVASAVFVGRQARKKAALFPDDGPLEFAGADALWIQKSFEHTATLEPVDVLLADPEP